MGSRKSSKAKCCCEEKESDNIEKTCSVAAEDGCTSEEVYQDILDFHHNDVTTYYSS